MSNRYDRPVDYGDPDHEAEVDAHNALNFLNDYAPKGLNDVGEVIPQPEPSSPTMEPLPTPTFKELMAENRRKLDEYRAEYPEEAAEIDRMESKWHLERLEE